MMLNQFLRNLIHKKRIFLIIFFALNANAAYLSYEDETSILKINYLEKCFDKNLNLSSYPYFYATLLEKLKSIKSNQPDKHNCQKVLHEVIEKLEKNIFRDETKISFITKKSQYYIQDLGKRVPKKSLVEYSHERFNRNFAYKINIQKEVAKDEFRFDESFISYLKNNTIFTVGRISRWWSPSDNTSLILSNNARPASGIGIKNNQLMDIQLPIIGQSIDFSYEIFLNRLEEKRHIPKPLLFGNRINFKLSNNLSLSLLRIAQFGGDGRPEDIDTILKMIIGKDTTNSNLIFEDQPGNQIAGIDFIYRFKDIKIYGQVLGEDGPDPLNKYFEIIKFPSKRFGLFGFSKSFDINEGVLKASYEYINTRAGENNITYNHSIYKSGYRSYKDSIGSSFDADTEASVLNFLLLNRKNYLIDVRYIDGKFNQNSNSNFNIDILNENIKIIDLSVTKNFQNYEIKFLSTYSNDKINQSNIDTSFFITYKF